MSSDENVQKPDPHAEQKQEERATEEASVAGETPGPVEPSPESQLPPEAQGPMNGGPLGCCLGITIGLLLSVGVVLVSRLYGEALFATLGGWTGLLIRLAMGLVALLAIIICGRLGWQIGKAIYKEYPKPQVPVWEGRKKKRNR